jgi:hypothetical protein
MFKSLDELLKAKQGLDFFTILTTELDFNLLLFLEKNKMDYVEDHSGQGGSSIYSFTIKGYRINFVTFGTKESTRKFEENDLSFWEDDMFGPLQLNFNIIK